MIESDYVMGIDGGGSASRGVAVTGAGELRVTATGGALNFYTTCPQTFRNNLADLRNRLASQLADRQCLHTVVGTAALLNVASNQEWDMATSGLPQASREELTLVGDALTAAHGATGGQAGVTVISGTGSVAISVKGNGRYDMRGGLGPLIGGDPGSAFWLASQAVLAAQLNQSPDGELCPLGSLICQYFQVGKLTELIPVLYGERMDTGRLAALAGNLAGNPEAEAIPEWLTIQEHAGIRLAEMTAPLFHSQTKPARIFASGSVLINNQRVRHSLTATLSQLLDHEIMSAEPRLGAPEGAALMALANAGIEITPGLLDRLQTSRS